MIFEINMILDDEQHRLTIDTKNMFDTISQFPEHIIKTKEIIDSCEIPKMYNIQQVIVSGLGGSAISGDILQSYTEDKGFLPLFVQRTYHLPKWINKHTLVFSQSYSGNTEETLFAFKQAYEKKCTQISITSNGKLLEYSTNRHIPCIILPDGYEPRCAIAFLFFSSLFALQKMGLFTNSIDKEIQETIDVTRRLIEQISPSIPVEQNMAKQISQILHHTIPQIYGWEIYTPLARRWATQFNENSKVISRHDTVPETNHNDIVGWSEDLKVASQFSVILFRDSSLESLQMKTRLDFMKTFYQQVAANLIEIPVHGKSPLAKMMYLLVLGDYVSCYLALLQNKDPTPVSIINQLKDTLQRL